MGFYLLSNHCLTNPKGQCEIQHAVEPLPCKGQEKGRTRNNKRRREKDQPDGRQKTNNNKQNQTDNQEKNRGGGNEERNETCRPRMDTLCKAKLITVEYSKWHSHRLKLNN